ncbi:MAG: sialate O-acetylesterase [Planctomycetia bacterium]|nr:sialate O-acetylesterase [Planctomycetia bacterium]
MALGLVSLLGWCAVARAEITDYTGGALNGYQVVYELNIPTNAGYATTKPAYTVNNSASIPQTNLVESVGYYLVLGSVSGTTAKTDWVFTSMTPFTSDLTKIGVPTVDSGAVFQTYVQNLYYKSNVSSLNATNGITVSQGNIEFWPTNYSRGNTAGIPNANADTYDFGDNRDTSGSHGSMQVHDYQNKTTVFAYNHWGGTDAGAIGIGNYTGSNPDWTFANNAKSYTTRQLGVYVKTLNFDAVTDKDQRAVIEGETANMEIVYKYNVGTDGSSRTTTLIDNSASTTSTLAGMPLKRTGYYYELTDKAGNKTYAYASFDALTNNRAKTGLPGTYSADGQTYSTFTHQTTVDNMTVQSNVAGVVNGTGIAKGNVEIWGTNYGTQNSANIPGASDSAHDFGDGPNTGGGYGSFQIHNYGEGQTVMALNQWTSNNANVGIGNNPNTGQPGAWGNAQHSDWTFAQTATNYSDVKLYVLAEAAIAPGMESVANGAEYSVVQGAKLTSQMSTNWHDNGLKYDIVDNVSTMQSSGKLFDRVGYYMEYAATEDSPLTYVFVSMDAFTDDISKIGVPTNTAGFTYQQTVKNLEVSSNVAATEGILTTGSFKNGYLEFWPSNYGSGKGSVISEGSGVVFDINDSGWSTSGGHGSMQVHNLDTGETVFAVNHFNGVKQYGIGTNPNGSTTSGSGGVPQLDWTFDQSKSGYKIANIYTFVREADAVLTTMDATSGVDFYQRDRGSNTAAVDISGSFKTADGVSIDKIQASADGTNWVDLTIDSSGSYNGSIDLSGGWHYVDVRALDAGGQVLTSTTTGKIGVGDIFITAGQSNSTNCGDAATQTLTGDVVSLNLATGQWQTANDPQPTTVNGRTDGSSRGSTWPAFGDALSEKLGVPVGIVSVGWSGSSIQQWNPANVDTSVKGWDTAGFNPTDSTLFGRLAYAIQELDGNVAGILWHQGESNAGSTQEYYQTLLESLVNASWEEAGWEIPWLVALVSRTMNDTAENPDKTGEIHPQIRAAQMAVIDKYDNVFLGPDSDALIEYLRGQNSRNGIHFSLAGLQALGYEWADRAGKGIYGFPEPSSWAMMLLGMVALLRYRRRKLCSC